MRGVEDPPPIVYRVLYGQTVTHTRMSGVEVDRPIPCRDVLKGAHGAVRALKLLPPPRDLHRFARGWIVLTLGAGQAAVDRLGSREIAVRSGGTSRARVRT